MSWFEKRGSECHKNNRKNYEFSTGFAKTNIIAVITGKFENYMLTVDDTLKEINRKLIRCWHIIQFIFFLKVLVKRCLQITVVTRPTSLD